MKTTCLLLFCATALVWSQRYSVTVDTGNCALSVNLFGGIGSTAPDTGIGDGFQYPKGTPSCLYCGAFLVANSESTVHDHFYGVPATQIHGIGFLPIHLLMSFHPCTEHMKCI